MNFGLNCCRLKTSSVVRKSVLKERKKERKKVFRINTNDHCTYLTFENQRLVRKTSVHTNQVDCLYAYVHVYLVYICERLLRIYTHCIHVHSVTGWRRPIGCLKLQLIFRNRATIYKALLQKKTYKDKASYDSTPPCNTSIQCVWSFVQCVYICNGLPYVHEYNV